jgi:hypothetical protein
MAYQGKCEKCPRTRQPDSGASRPIRRWRHAFVASAVGITASATSVRGIGRGPVGVVLAESVGVDFFWAPHCPDRPGKDHPQPRPACSSSPAVERPDWGRGAVRQSCLVLAPWRSDSPTGGENIWDTSHGQQGHELVFYRWEAARTRKRRAVLFRPPRIEALRPRPDERRSVPEPR